jgi:pyrimidine-nucleoside phosphorylase
MMTPSWIIQKKRDGKELQSDEIHYFIRGLSSGEVADYQATAFLMAVYFRGMSLAETVWLTEAMIESGEKYDLSHIPGVKVDKHSTGGIGDKVSIILAPLAAACGLRVPMMAGRGLGHTGGTLDKLEAISGFNVNLDRRQFEAVIDKVGCAIVGQTAQIAPADKKLYALRDVTGTVECIPLIVASILSKKISEGTNGLVMDVKIGSGAFMKTRSQAQRLGKGLIQVAKKLNLPCRAILTSMSQPLGYSVGNAIEIQECIEILKNEKTNEFSSADLKELTIHLCAQMLNLGRVSRNLSEGRKLAHSKLADGSAWRVFEKLVEAQGGDVSQLSSPKRLPNTPRVIHWKSKRRGFVTRMNAENMGRIVLELGGGRKKASDTIDPRVGIIFHKKLGNKVQLDEPLVSIHSPENFDLSHLENLFHQSIEIRSERKAVPKLIFEQL